MKKTKKGLSVPKLDFEAVIKVVDQELEVARERFKSLSAASAALHSLSESADGGVVVASSAAVEVSMTAATRLPSNGEISISSQSASEAIQQAFSVSATRWMDVKTLADRLRQMGFKYNGNGKNFVPYLRTILRRNHAIFAKNSRKRGYYGMKKKKER